jgi:hypothetical protein
MIPGIRLVLRICATALLALSAWTISTSISVHHEITAEALNAVLTKIAEAAAFVALSMLPLRKR